MKCIFRMKVGMGAQFVNWCLASLVPMSVINSNTLDLPDWYHFIRNSCQNGTVLTRYTCQFGTPLSGKYS